MTMPIVPTDPRIEMFLNNVGWVDITADCRLSSADSGGGIEISRGVPNEGNIAEPTQVNFVLNNREGKYSPKNPTSPNFGKLGRNQPIRVHVNPADDNFTIAPSTSGLGPRWSHYPNASMWSRSSIGATIAPPPTQHLSLANEQIHGDGTVRTRFKVSARITSQEIGVVLRATPPPQVTPSWGFEDNLDAFFGTGGNLTRTTAQQHTGSYSALLTATGSASEMYMMESAYTSVVAGRPYRWFAWVRSGSAITVRHQVDWYTSAGAFVLSAFVDTPLAAGTWGQLILDATAPATAARARISFRVQGTPAAGTTLYVDDIAAFDRSDGWGWYSAHVQIDPDGQGDRLRVRYNANGVERWWSFFLSNYGITLAANSWYWIEGQITGQYIRARVWADGAATPRWQASALFQDYDDTLPPMSGQGGIFVNNVGLSPTSLVSFTEVAIRDYRAHAEIAELPPRFDLSRSDRWVPIQARGILRRLGQGRKALESAVYRRLSLYSANAVYWYALEHEGGSTMVGSDVPGGQQATIQGAALEDVQPNEPGLGGAVLLSQVGQRIVAPARYLPASGKISAFGFFQVNGNPASGTEMRLMTIGTSGDARTIKVNINPGPAIKVTVVSSDGTEYASGNFSYTASSVNFGDFVAMNWYAYQSGSNIVWALNWHKPGSGVFLTTGDVTMPGNLGRLTSVIVGATQQHVDTGGLGVAHLAGYNIDLPFVTASFAVAATAYTGETAANRFVRLLDEQNITNTVIGTANNAVPMGPQLPAKLTDLLQECAEAEDGLLGEGRAEFGLFFKTRAALYNQPRTLLDIDAGHMSEPLEPIDDDQATRNDVTVNRPNGGSATSIQLTGPLNVNPPESDVNGVGIYDETVDRNVVNDTYLQTIADVRRARGTLDESRYPSIRTDFTATAYLNDVRKAMIVASRDLGGILRVKNPEVSPDSADQIVGSYVEWIDQYDREITWSASPAKTYRVGVLARTTRPDTEHSFTAGGFTSGTHTALLVARDSTFFVPWVLSADSPASFPFDILVAGVRLRVTAITGTSDPQTMTVQQTPINGVIKAIPVGSQVRLFSEFQWRLAR